MKNKNLNWDNDTNRYVSEKNGYKEWQKEKEDQYYDTGEGDPDCCDIGNRDDLIQKLAAWVIVIVVIAFISLAVKIIYTINQPIQI